MFERQDVTANTFVCADCGKSFQNQDTLSWHSRSVHAANYPRPTQSAGEVGDRARGSGQVLVKHEGARAFEREAQDGLTDSDEDELTPDGMRSELRGWGVGLILLGVAQFFIPFLDPFWAFVVIPLGAISLFIAHRGLFMAIGATLIVVGLLNIFGGSFGGWTLFGVAQIYWGVQEIRKFGKYADAQ